MKKFVSYSNLFYLIKCSHESLHLIRKFINKLEAKLDLGIYLMYFNTSQCMDRYSQ